ncbi:MAG: hypothetical protein NZ108_05010, partial [Bacteroidia bacterium]|nr:hypothetical protein [Bacteroidia bacterium]
FLFSTVSAQNSETVESAQREATSRKFLHFPFSASYPQNREAFLAALKPKLEKAPWQLSKSEARGYFEGTRTWAWGSGDSAGTITCKFQIGTPPMRFRCTFSQFQFKPNKPENSKAYFLDNSKELPPTMTKERWERIWNDAKQLAESQLKELTQLK